MLLAEEETAARQAAAKQTKKQKQKLRKQLTRQLTQQQPTQHQQHQPAAQNAHVEASQAGQNTKNGIHSRLAGPAEPNQATSTAAPEPQCAGQRPCRKESDTAQTCTTSSQDQDRQADSLAGNPLFSEQGTQQRSAAQTSSTCTELLAQPHDPVCSVDSRAPCRDPRALIQDTLASCVQHSALSTDLSVAEPASLPAGSLQAWEASGESTEGSEPEQSGNNRIEGVHLHSLLVCPLTQVGTDRCVTPGMHTRCCVESTLATCRGDFSATRQYLDHTQQRNVQ